MTFANYVWCDSLGPLPPRLPSSTVETIETLNLAARAGSERHGKACRDEKHSGQFHWDLSCIAK